MDLFFLNHPLFFVFSCEIASVKRSVVNFTTDSQSLALMYTQFLFSAHKPTFPLEVTLEKNVAI